MNMNQDENSSCFGIHIIRIQAVQIRDSNPTSKYQNFSIQKSIIKMMSTIKRTAQTPPRTHTQKVTTTKFQLQGSTLTI